MFFTIRSLLVARIFRRWRQDETSGLTSSRNNFLTSKSSDDFTIMNDLSWANDESGVKVSQKSSKVGLFLVGLTGGIGVALSVICVPFVSPALRRICLPYVPATTQQVDNVLRALQHRSGTLIDLGSGDGRLVFAAAKNGFKASGVELNAWLVLYSRISAFVQGLSSRTKFYRQDLWNFNLEQYDNVIIFGVEQMMEELEEKFTNELRQDCRIVACRFPLPNLKPLKTIGEGVDTVWVYAISSRNSRSP